MLRLPCKFIKKRKTVAPLCTPSWRVYHAAAHPAPSLQSDPLHSRPGARPEIVLCFLSTLVLTQEPARHRWSLKAERNQVSLAPSANASCHLSRDSVPAEIQVQRVRGLWKRATARPRTRSSGCNSCAAGAPRRGFSCPHPDPKINAPLADGRVPLDFRYKSNDHEAHSSASEFKSGRPNLNTAFPSHPIYQPRKRGAH